MRRVHVAVFILALATCAPRGLAQSAISAAGKVQADRRGLSWTADSNATDEFLQRLRYGREDVQRQVLRVTVAYMGLRILLIGFASAVAFGKNFKETHFKSLVSWVPVFSLFVAIGTGVDTFLKLGQHRSGDYNYISNVEDLEIRAKSILAGGVITLQELQDLEERYSAIKAQHRRETAF